MAAIVTAEGTTISTVSVPPEPWFGSSARKGCGHGRRVSRRKWLCRGFDAAGKSDNSADDLEIDVVRGRSIQKQNAEAHPLAGSDAVRPRLAGISQQYQNRGRAAKACHPLPRFISFASIAITRSNHPTSNRPCYEGPINQATPAHPIPRSLWLDFPGNHEIARI